MVILQDYIYIYINGNFVGIPGIPIFRRTHTIVDVGAIVALGLFGFKVCLYRLPLVRTHQQYVPSGFLQWSSPNQTDLNGRKHHQTHEEPYCFRSLTFEMLHVIHVETPYLTTSSSLDPHITLKKMGVPIRFGFWAIFYGSTGCQPRVQSGP